MSTISQPPAESSQNSTTGIWGPLLIGTAGVAIAAAWVVLLFFVVPALMK